LDVTFSVLDLAVQHLIMPTSPLREPHCTTQEDDSSHDVTDRLSVGRRQGSWHLVV